LVSRLRAVPARVVGVRVGRAVDQEDSVTITDESALQLARLLDVEPVHDGTAPDEALQVALRHRGLDDVTVSTGDEAGVRIGVATLAAAEALARLVSDIRDRAR
jgi:hypothetical protein